MQEIDCPVYAMLLAGGSGTRLWPVSRQLYPKQLVKFIGDDSLVQSTIKRLTPPLEPRYIRIVCGKEHIYEIGRHMEDIGLHSKGKIIHEPCGRNTAPAILLGVLSILANEKDAILCVFPADHVIRDTQLFHQKLETAVQLADQGHIVTFGIEPNYPETGYGYIESDQYLSDSGARQVKRFVEKPDSQTASEYIKSGNFYWNSGMFAFKASVIVNEFEKFTPELLNKMRSLNMSDVSEAEYKRLPDISFDYAIMEKTDKVVVLPSDFGWSDIGSWKSLYDFLPKDENQNVIDGDVIAKDTHNCFILGHQRLIATNYLRDTVVIETPDSVFVSDINNSRDVKSIVTQLKEKNRKEYHVHRTVYHPWGIITVLEQQPNLQVLKMTIYPNSEVYWEIRGTIQLMVTEGTLKIEEESQIYGPGESVKISKDTTSSNWVTVKNAGLEPVVIVEVEAFVNP